MSEAPRKTGKWLRNDVPHTGWSCATVEEGASFCEMCEVTPIVYAHVMKHERYPIPLYCGCVCAGFMTDDPATEQMRELLYKWQRLQRLHRTPVEKLRRQNWTSMRWRRGRWRGNNVRTGHTHGWHHCNFDFDVEISNPDGWRFHVYYGRGMRKRELKTSESFTSDLDAALAGIAWAEMLMTQQWLASDSEARAEEKAAWQAKQEADDIQYTAKRARELGCEDIAAAMETREVAIAHAWHLLRARKAQT